MAFIDDAFSAISDLNLWFKVQAGDTYTLADISPIIPLRWSYFRDNWLFIVEGLQEQIPTYRYPNLLKRHIEEFGQFIEIQRHNQRKGVNPLSKSDIVTQFYAVFDVIDITSISLTKEEETIIDEEVSRVSSFTRNDFLDIREKIILARDEISDTVGHGDSSYNDTYDRGSIAKERDARIGDIMEMLRFQNAIKAIDFILANIYTIDTVFVDPFALARQNANNPDLEINTGRSGYLVRMNFGDTLQDLAERHLGDADRWLEIAITNGLKPPYIDEYGETISPLSNGENTQINLPAVFTDGAPMSERVFIGQTIFLQSSTIKYPEARQILSIFVVPVSGEVVLTLNGESDLDKFKISEGFTVRIFKPHTANSSFLIMIPTGQAPDTLDKPEPFFLKASAEDEKRQQIDLSVDDNMDLVFQSIGDVQLSYGLTNAVQAIKIKTLIEEGSLFRHPTFGFTTVVGSKNASIEDSRQEIINSLNSMIESDPRFDRVESLTVGYGETDTGASAFTVRMVVRLAGSTSLLPINFTLNVS